MTNKEKLLKYMQDKSFENYWYGWDNVVDETAIEEKEARILMKELCKEGKCYCAPLYNEDDGKFYGKGYFAYEPKGIFS
jgi:hypothetical protein